MKILTFLGSPRKHGNTATLLDSVINGIKSIDNNSVEQIFLNEKNIRPCQGCNSCKKDGADGCIQKDDMQNIYPLIAKSDLIILATPIYWWSVTAQMKLLIDRIYGMDFTCGRKKVALLMTYGGELPNSGPETTEALFREICAYIKADPVAVMGVCSETIEVKDNKKALDDAFELGRMLAGF
ncbi:MAG TPA: flavodoxin family protein [Spirochaetota bacterium]|nr:flavodoxin family protein [Spirochaetota bacterium]HPF07887.1 flavodoxin family protein [Spirochaetota bacterium]HRX49323.1 flavodoxin family protein [Spirochaetota bacterium]